MADGPGYDAPLKRRREGRTDYEKRLELLKSGDPRAVIRISNNHARIQIVQYQDSGDSTIVSAASGDLEAFGWNGHTGNLTAAYLAGFLAGRRAVSNGIESVASDLGVYSRERGSRHYAALEGLKDAGLDVSLDDRVSPEDDRVKGAHLQDGDASETFEEVKKSINAEYGEN